MSFKSKPSTEAVLLTDDIDSAIQRLQSEAERKKQDLEQRKADQRRTAIPRSATEDVAPSILGHAPTLPYRGSLTPLRKRPSLIPRAATSEEEPPVLARKGRGPEASPFRRFLVNRQKLEDGAELEEPEGSLGPVRSESGSLPPLSVSRSIDLKLPPPSPFFSSASRTARSYTAALSEASSFRLTGFDVSAFSLASAPVTASVSPSSTLPPRSAVSLPPPSPDRDDDEDYHPPVTCLTFSTPKQIDGSVQSPLGCLASALCSYQAVVHERQQHLFVVRHAESRDVGEPAWKASAQRPWDPPLSSLGKAQAYKLGASLRSDTVPIHRVVCSPYLRCVETAAEILKALSARDQEVAARLMEIEDSFGVVGAPAKLPRVGSQEALQAQGLEGGRKKGGGLKRGGRRQRRKQDVRLRAHIEPALCEIRMISAVAPEAVSDEARMFLPREDLEALLLESAMRSAGNGTHFLPPGWKEEVGEGMKRILGAGDYLCEQFPEENILLVTHSEAVQGSTLRCLKKATVYNVKPAGFVHLERTVYVDIEDEEDRGVTPWKLMTRNGATGVFFTS